MYRKTSESRNKERTQPIVLFSVYLLGGINNTQISEKESPHCDGFVCTTLDDTCIRVMSKVEPKTPTSTLRMPSHGMSSSSSSGSIGM